MKPRPYRNVTYKPRTDTSSMAKKLTPEMVLEIRRVYKLGKYTNKQIGDAVGITSKGVADIVQRKTWKNL